MTLPTFVGIGAERSGSTWLHELLQSHPRIYVPSKRKELDFFTANYDRGLTWYESFFPDASEAAQYAAIGEISPRYLHKETAAERMSDLPSIRHLLAILRNPADRAYSHFGHALRLGMQPMSFEDFLTERPTVIRYGRYAELLEPFLERYSADQLCCLVFEHAVADVDIARTKVAAFLGVAADEFPEDAGTRRVNETFSPRLKRLNRLSARARDAMVARDQDWLVNAAKKLGAQKVLRAGSKSTPQPPPMAPATRRRLLDMYEPDIERLEHLIGADLTGWRS